MEARVSELLSAHAEDRNLSGEKELVGLDWSKADLHGYNLAHCELSAPGRTAIFTEANLNEATLFRAKLENATLDGARLCRVDLRGANLEGAYLQGVDLSGAQMENCQLSGAYLAKANLQGADLSHVQYIGGDLIGANLRGANLAGATLEAIDASKADFSNATLRSSHLNQCYFEKARFDETDLADSQLQDCNFSQSHLDHANLARAQATECSFTECHLNDANLAGAKALECEFDRAHLKGAILVIGDYTKSSFDDVHLQGSFLNGASFAHCSLEGADLRNSKVREADFTGARLFQTTLNGANMEFAKLEEVWTYDQAPEPEFPKAMDLYRNLKNTFRDNGAHSRASRYSYLESVMQRRQFRKQERWGMWVLYLLADAVCGYGEHIEKILATALAIILIYAVAYHVGEGVVNRTLPEDTDQELGFREHLYFSVTTFTTLGYGDYSPSKGPYQILAVSEAILGVVLMAFLVVTLTRKIVT